MIYRKVIGLLILAMYLSALSGQTIVINELMSSNTSYYDEYGESSDWIELYNASENNINLKNWGLSDSNDPDDCWKFGDVKIEPGTYLMIRASDRDINVMSHYTCLIREGDEWKYLIPDQTVADNWKTVEFDDTDWSAGASGFGYGDEDDNTIVPEGTRSVFLRKSFPIETLDEVEELIAHIDYDDGFILFLNGTEVARVNIGSPGEITAYSATSTTDHEANIYSGGIPDRFDLSDHISKLNVGENILAIQVHNVSQYSSDLSIIPFLTLKLSKNGDHDVPELLNISETYLHSDFKLSSAGETLYLFSDDGNVVDWIEFPALEKDISFGRLEDGANPWVMFETPTPGSTNEGEIFEGTLPDSLQFSHPSGIYSTAFYLSLTGSDSIFYTLDASEPLSFSTLYDSPVLINKNTFIQTRIIKNGKSSRIYSANYLLNANHDLPVISLKTEEDNLWDNDFGMYVFGDNHEPSFPYFGANFWEDWEYPFHIDYFNAAGENVLSTWSGARIFGGYTRAFNQKSFSLFARSIYGDSSFEYPFFTHRPYDAFEALVLRNGGNDWDRGFIRDVVMTSLMRGSSIDFQEYQPVVCYLNNEYWGIYNLREKINEHFIASLHDVDPDEVDLLELNGTVRHGENAEYLALLDFMQNNSLAIEANYDNVADQIDMKNLIEYFVAQIYFNNTDWPGNNIRYWKTKEGRWRWILYDTDFGLNLFDANGHSNNTLSFALEPNGPSWPNPPWSTFLFRKLIENVSFRQTFINYFADNINTRFLPGFAKAHLDEVLATYGNELSQHLQRWGQNQGFWQENIERMRYFFDFRPSIMRSHIRSQFSLPGSHTVTVEIEEPGTGIIQLNSLTLDYSKWSGYYFANNPIHLTAVPKPGYHFDRWSGDIESTETSIEIDPGSITDIKAHFLTVPIEENPVVINEINYNSPDHSNASDWIELYNGSENPIDLSGWILKDNDDEHQYLIPNGTTLSAKGYLVLCRNMDNFTAIHNEVEPLLGNFDFGLSSNGDAVRLYDVTGTLMDSVAFLPVDPWPEEANGLGPTLELLSPALDNALAKNWRSFEGIGTPGNKNHLDPLDTIDTDESLILRYPNPATDELNLAITSQDLFFNSVAIYNHSGKLINRVDFKAESRFSKINISTLEQGLYLVLITCSDGKMYSKVFEKY